MVLILGTCWYSLVAALGKRYRLSGFGVLGRRWFSLVFALGRREIHPRHLTFPESGQRLPSQTIRLPSVKMTREMSKTGSGYSRIINSEFQVWCIHKQKT